MVTTAMCYAWSVDTEAGCWDCVYVYMQQTLCSVRFSALALPDIKSIRPILASKACTNTGTC